VALTEALDHLGRVLVARKGGDQDELTVGVNGILGLEAVEGVYVLSVAACRGGVNNNNDNNNNNNNRSEMKYSWIDRMSTVY
jgi:hypothetical protein